MFTAPGDQSLPIESGRLGEEPRPWTTGEGSARRLTPWHGNSYCLFRTRREHAGFGDRGSVRSGRLAANS